MSPPLPYGASPNLPVAQASAALSSAPIRNPYEEFTGPQFDDQLRRALEYRTPNPAPQSSETQDATNGDDADVEMDDSFTEVEPGGDAAANAEGKGRGVALGSARGESILTWTGKGGRKWRTMKYARIVERESEDRSIPKDTDDDQNDDDVLPGSSPIYSSPVEPQYSPSANHDVFILYELEDKGAHDTHNQSKSSDWDHRPTSASGAPLSGAAYLAVEDSDIAQFPQPDEFPELETFEASDQLPTLGAPSVPLPIVSDLLGPVNSTIRVVRQEPHKRTRAEAEGFSAQAEVLSAATSRPRLDRTCKRRRQSTAVLAQSGSPGKEQKTKKAGDPPGCPHIHWCDGAGVEAPVQCRCTIPGQNTAAWGDSYIGKPPHVDARVARLQYNRVFALQPLGPSDGCLVLHKLMANG
ncbi:hypothetical protein B0H14DRAFT_3590728 [Mycena olivaceomarginata]|nr:hypothetical protein B0H14DRAFT_3590728 [Mycena olivaceomarginata]